jgi:hypothetical protein
MVTLYERGVASGWEVGGGMPGAGVAGAKNHTTRTFPFPVLVQNHVASHVMKRVMQTCMLFLIAMLMLLFHPDRF